MRRRGGYRGAVPRSVTATRYVAPLREGGSMPGLVEADDDGLYVVKFRGAGQGPLTLVAELLVGGLARHLGLPVPEVVLVEIDTALGAAEPDPEIQDLIAGSGGTNAGLDFQPGALAYAPGGGFDVEPTLAADIVWFDALVANVDRTARNPNLLLWHRRLWMIDHGAALYHQHGDFRPASDARRPFAPVAEHVLLPAAGSIAESDARLAHRIDAGVLEALSSEIPADWLTSPGAPRRADYVEYLLARLRGPRRFAEEAERARHHA